MDNHVHLMLVPETVDGLRGPLASAHTAYAQLVNREQELGGHLFQGRFASYPMDDAHMMVAARYIENNPVKAGLVEAAEDWSWSSAAAHINGRSEGLPTSLRWVGTSATGEQCWSMDSRRPTASKVLCAQGVR